MAPFGDDRRAKSTARLSGVYLADRRPVVDSPVMERPPRYAPSAAQAVLAGLATLLAGCGTLGTQPAVRPPAVTDAAFCRDVQQAIVGTRLVADNEVFTDLDGFVKSKPVAKPLQTRQYLWPEDGVPDRPRMVSCKMKTADHLIAEHGAGQAGADIGCSGVNRLTLRGVAASLTRDERRRLRFDPDEVVLEADFVTTLGPVWLEPYPMARLGADGRLHIQSRAMRNDWLDPRYLEAPPQFRGTRYCHLVAPEHLRRLLLGEVAPAAAP
jgi:hypothetical protein